MICPMPRRQADADGRLMLPEQFIPLAEWTGLIIPPGRPILKQACRQTALWQRQGFGQFTMGGNLSARQFQQRDLLEIIRAILQTRGLAPQSLELEVTESTFMANVAQADQTFKQLYAIGVKLALDDFGTGYSSLKGNFRFKNPRPIGLSLAASSHDPDDVAVSQAVISLVCAWWQKFLRPGNNFAIGVARDATFYKAISSAPPRAREKQTGCSGRAAAWIPGR